MQTKRFCVLLPLVQCPLAALFGGVGLGERSAILSRPFIAGSTFWDTTASFHVWPWPFKFSVIENLPAFISGVLLSFPISALKPNLPERAQLAPSLLFVLFLWYWIGLRLDRLWTGREKAPWLLIVVFTAVSLTGALLPIGHTGYLPFAVLLWLILALLFRRRLTSLKRT